MIAANPRVSPEIASFSHWKNALIHAAAGISAHAG